MGLYPTSVQSTNLLGFYSAVYLVQMNDWSVDGLLQRARLKPLDVGAPIIFIPKMGQHRPYGCI